MNGCFDKSARPTRRPSPKGNFRTLLLVACCAASLALLGAVRSPAPLEPLMAVSAPTVAGWNDASPADETPLGALDNSDEPILGTAQPSNGELLHDVTGKAPAIVPAALDLSPAPASPVASVALSSIASPAIAVPILQLPRTRQVMMEVTAYCACPRCCGPRAQGITASGRRVTYNGGRFVAADTRLLKFNTKLLIPGYANNMPVEVIDRGGAIKGNKLDVFFASHEEARKWGRQKLWVTVIE